MGPGNERERQLRAAARRRAGYPAEVVAALAPKPLLYADLDLGERLVHMTALCRAQWLASGRSIDARERSEWPGETFVIGDG